MSTDPAQLALAAWLSERGDVHAALLLARNVAAAGDARAANRLRAEVLASAGRHQEAADAWRKVLADTPDDAAARRGLGRALRLARSPVLAWLVRPPRLPLALAGAAVVLVAAVLLAWPHGPTALDRLEAAAKRIEQANADLRGEVARLGAAQTATLALIQTDLREQSAQLAALRDGLPAALRPQAAAIAAVALEVGQIRTDLAALAQAEAAQQTATLAAIQTNLREPVAALATVAQAVGQTRADLAALAQADAARRIVIEQRADDAARRQEAETMALQHLDARLDALGAQVADLRAAAIALPPPSAITLPATASDPAPPPPTAPDPPAGSAKP